MDGILSVDHLAVLILDLELAITRNVCEVIGDPLHTLRRLDEFHHDLWRTADHGLQFLSHIGRTGLRCAKPPASTYGLG